MRDTQQSTVLKKLLARLAKRSDIDAAKVERLNAGRNYIEDMRESPSVRLMELLRAKGAAVHYSDPHVPVFPAMREHRFELAGVPLTPKAIASYDVLLATSHSAFDYQLLQKHARLIVDTRGVYLERLPNVVKA